MRFSVSPILFSLTILKRATVRAYFVKYFSRVSFSVPRWYIVLTKLEIDEYRCALRSLTG